MTEPTRPSHEGGGHLRPDTILTRSAEGLRPITNSLTPAQARADALVSSFVDHATDGYSLAAMVGGGLVYRLGRVGTLALGSRLFTPNALPLTSSLLRFTSIGVGFTGEVFTFEAGQRALRVGIGGADPNLLRWSGENGLGRGLVGAAITLGSLKWTGAFVNGQNPVLQHLFQDSAMVLAHNVSGGIGITDRPLESFAEQMVNAEATLWQMNAGMALVHGAFPGLGQVERSLDLSVRLGVGAAPRGRPILGTHGEVPLHLFNEPLLATTGGGRGESPREFIPTIFHMSGPKDGEGGGSRDAVDPTGKTVPGMGPPGPSLDRPEPPSSEEAAPPSGDTVQGIPAGFAKTVMPQGAVPPPTDIVLSATSPSPAGVQTSLPPPSMGRLEPGRILGGRYQVVEYVGAGGFGQVYRGVDTTLGREVAIKALHPEVDTAENQERFENEIKITAKLDPRRVVQVYDLIREPDVGTVQIMEYVPGHDLSDVWQNLPISKRLDVFARICEGVDSGHRLGFIHRDLKPENVRMTPDGDVLVMDWGLGKQFREAALTGAGLTPELVSHLKIRRDLTVAGGGPPGTAGNIAPEAFRGEVIANPRGVDVFALGTMLYEMVTGQHPYADYEHRSPIENYLSTHPKKIGPPPPFRHVVEGEFPDFFYKIEEVARRATEADPARRYQSTQELREAVLMVRARAEFDRIREIRRGMIETEQEMHRAWAEYRVDRQISPEQEERMHRPIQTLIGRRQEMDQAAENLVTYLTQLTNNERAPEARKMIAELSWLRLVHGGDRMDARVRQMLMERIHDYDIATPGEPKTSMKDSLDGVLPVAIRGVDRLQGRERTLELGVRVIPIEEYEPGFYREGEPLIAGFLGQISEDLQFRAGYYVFEVSHPEYGFMRVPVHIKLKHVRRGILEGRPFSLNLDLIPRDQVPPGFYLVQGGEGTVGLDIHRYEDPSSVLSRPQRRISFNTFAISNVPAKDQYKQFLDNYLDYVNQLVSQGRFPEAAHLLEQVRDWIPRGQAKVPKRDLQGYSDWDNLFAAAFDGVAYHWKVVQTGQGRERRFRLVDPWGQPGLFGDVIRPDQPIDAIPGNAAEAYTAWFDYQWRLLPDGRLREDRPRVQLSSHLQNQIIARNSFEWLYPWGYHFLRTYLASRLVHRDVRKDAYLHPRGTHPLGRELYHDFSIYGGVNQRLVDILGNDRQWTSTPAEDNTLVMSGGSVRSPSGHYFFPTSETYSTRKDWVAECNGGFRMAVEFPPEEVSSHQ